MTWLHIGRVSFKELFFKVYSTIKNARYQIYNFLWNQNFCTHWLGSFCYCTSFTFVALDLGKIWQIQKGIQRLFVVQYLNYNITRQDRCRPDLQYCIQDMAWIPSIPQPKTFNYSGARIPTIQNGTFKVWYSNGPFENRTFKMAALA